MNPNLTFASDSSAPAPPSRSPSLSSSRSPRSRRPTGDRAARPGQEDDRRDRRRTLTRRRAPPRPPARGHRYSRLRATVRTGPDVIAGASRSLSTRALLAALWLLHWLPLACRRRAAAASAGSAGISSLAPQGRPAQPRALLPELGAAERERLAREHFRWLGRSLLERGLLWYAIAGAAEAADPGRGRRRPGRAQRPAGDVAGAALHGPRRRRRLGAAVPEAARAISIYQAQSNPVLDAALRRGRLRFGNAEIFSRDEAGKALVRAIRHGDAFFNLPDMDFGTRDAAFVPFFGVPAVTLLAPSRLARALDMIVQPIVAEMLPGGARLPRPLRGAVDRLPERRPGRRRGAHEPLDRGARSGAIRRSTSGCIGASRRGRRASRRCTRVNPRRCGSRFTKMQGAGNDFVVLDATRAPLALDDAQLRALADRRFGVGADQILIVEQAPRPGRLRLPHLQRRQRRRGRALRQRRALLRPLRARQGPQRQDDARGRDR